MNVGELKEAIHGVPDWFLVCFGRMETHDTFYIQPDGLAIVDFSADDNSIGFDDDCMRCEDMEDELNEMERHAHRLADQVEQLVKALSQVCADVRQIGLTDKDPALLRHIEEAESVIIHNRV